MAKIYLDLVGTRQCRVPTAFHDWYNIIPIRALKHKTKKPSLINKPGSQIIFLTLDAFPSYFVVINEIITNKIVKTSLTLKHHF
jgi:hypothetical protein